MWSIIAARSAERTGWLTRGEMFMIAVPMWICSVAWATYPMTTSGADRWLYSVRAWCSPNQTYFQLWRSAWMASSISRMRAVCSDSLSWAAGPGT